MSLAETQNFFFDLCAKPGVIVSLKKNKERTLQKYFRSARDREFLGSYTAERFQTYRNHISFGILGGMESAFPVLRSLLSEKEWNEVLNQFYLKRLTRSPIARHVFREFSGYLQKTYRGPLLKKLPYLRELAEYENLDLKLYFAKDAETTHQACFVDPLSVSPEKALHLVPILNPLVELRTYQWPVHRICREFCSPKKVKKGKYSLIIFRHPQELEIRFMEGNPLTMALIKALKRKPSPIQKTFKALIKKNKIQNLQTFYEEGMAVLGLFLKKGIILGYQL